MVNIWSLQQDKEGLHSKYKKKESNMSNLDEKKLKISEFGPNLTSFVFSMQKIKLRKINRTREAHLNLNHSHEQTNIYLKMTIIM